MTLINTDLNRYEGLAAVRTRKGNQKFRSVYVSAGPTGAMFYQPDPVSASNLIDAANKEQEPQGKLTSLWSRQGDQRARPLMR